MIGDRDGVTRDVRHDIDNDDARVLPVHQPIIVSFSSSFSDNGHVQPEIDHQNHHHHPSDSGIMLNGSEQNGLEDFDGYEETMISKKDRKKLKKRRKKKRKGLMGNQNARLKSKIVT